MPQPQAKIAHPNRPGEWVLLHLPTRREDRQAVYDSVNHSRVPVAVINPNTGLPWVNEMNGRVQEAWRVSIGNLSEDYHLADSIDDWYIMDADGNAIKFVRENARKDVWLLGEEHLDVTVEGQQVQPFAEYLRALLSKRETFVPNSTAPASSTP